MWASMAKVTYAIALATPGIDLFTVFSTFCMDQLGKTVDATEKRASEMSRLWGAVSSLDFNKSLWNLAILLILRRFFQWRRRIFPNLSMSKVEKKPWKGLLAGKGLMRSPWGSSPVGGLMQRVDFSGVHRSPRNLSWSEVTVDGRWLVPVRL